MAVSRPVMAAARPRHGGVCGVHQRVGLVLDGLGKKIGENLSCELRFLLDKPDSGLNPVLRVRRHETLRILTIVHVDPCGPIVEIITVVRGGADGGDREGVVTIDVR